jgi:phage terminase small subunit
LQVSERAVCPASLDDLGRKYWERFAPVLERLGLLTLVEEMAFAALCNHYAGWELAMKEYNENPRRGKRSLQEIVEVDVVDENGGPAKKKLVYQSPSAFTEMKYHEEEIKKYWREFCLTPGYRAGVAMPAGDDVDDLESLLDGGSRSKPRAELKPPKIDKEKLQ